MSSPSADPAPTPITLKASMPLESPSLLSTFHLHQIQEYIYSSCADIVQRTGVAFPALDGPPPESDQQGLQFEKELVLWLDEVYTWIWRHRPDHEWSDAQRGRRAIISRRPAGGFKRQFFEQLDLLSEILLPRQGQGQMRLWRPPYEQEEAQQADEGPTQDAPEQSHRHQKEGKLGHDSCRGFRCQAYTTTYVESEAFSFVQIVDTQPACILAHEVNVHQNPLRIRSNR